MRITLDSLVYNARRNGSANVGKWLARVEKDGGTVAVYNGEWCVLSVLLGVNDKTGEYVNVPYIFTENPRLSRSIAKILNGRP